MGDAAKAPERDKRLHLTIALASIEQARSLMLWLYEADDPEHCADRLDQEVAPHLAQADRSLSDAVRALRGQPKRPEQVCIIGKHCSRHGFIHGAEAEELREGIEQILAHGRCGGVWLQRLLDKVDARDSLAWLEYKR